MDDTSAQQAAIQTSGFSPPTQSAAHFVFTMNANEVLLTVGQSRVPINLQTGVAGGPPGIEWFLTLAMSPIAAQQLANVMPQLLAQYEKQFGKIPHDPAQAAPEMQMVTPSPKA